MRRLRTLTFFLSIAITIGLICIGFSSWTISGSFVGVSGIGGLNSYSVIDVSEYISLDTSKGTSNTGITPFQFNSNGYIDNEDGSTTGTITVYYKFDREKCVKTFGSSITVDFYLRAIDVYEAAINMREIFYNDSYISSSATSDGNVFATRTADDIDSSNNIKVSYTFSDFTQANTNNQYITFALNYEFKPTEDQLTIENYFSDIYNKLYKEGSPAKTATFYTYVQISQTTAS